MTQFIRAKFTVAIVLLLAAVVAAAQQRPAPPPPTPGPMLEQGTQDFDTPDFTLTLVKASQTIAALKPKKAGGFDFTPGDLLIERSRDGYYHLGDIVLRLRTGDTGDWKNYSTAEKRQPVKALSASGNILAAADLAPSLPADIPLQITRTWALLNGQLVMRFTIKNTSSQPVEIGALGIPMVFNNVMNRRKLDEAHEKCSFFDPYIGEDAGYLQVTRLNGHGPALIVVPFGKTPFEAYSPIVSPPFVRPGQAGPPRVSPEQRDFIFTDPTPRGVTFEGFYNWMVYSKAFADNEWKNAQQWNQPTMVTLKPGEDRTYGVQFLLSPEIRDIEKTLAVHGRPVAVGIPGYVLPEDIDARLFLNYAKPVKSMTVEPAGAITIEKNPRTSSGWSAYTLRGKTWGRARLSITYSDGLFQTIAYDVIKPEAQAVADLGNFLTTKQWFNDTNDPFHRAPSVITYNRDLNQQVTQDTRVWIAGLSDEGGAGSWLAAAMKEFGQPKKEEVDKFQQFVDGVLWGRLQFSDGDKQYGVRKSVFYYQPDEFPNYYDSTKNWKSWTSWNQKASEAVDRSYNYPHVVAAYWSMYRLARNHQGLVTDHPWDWYLTHAYETTMAMMKLAPYYTRFGLMEGDIFLKVLQDLKREGMTEQANALEAAMRKRADRWKDEAYPFGSEMPWDSTGQEEVYAWTKYFGYKDKADVTLNAILGYMPTVPHWGYNGSARRYWDFIYAGGIQRLERQLHHYGSGINAIPVLSEYRDHPDDLYLLRIGYGGTMGALTDIDQEGFMAPAFHAFPDLLRPDPLSGDNGPNFFGHALNTATYVVNSPQFGWIAFGGNIRENRGVIDVKPLDSFRTRVYVAPFGLWLTLEAGTFDSVEVNTKAGTVRVGLSPSDQFTTAARLRVEQPAKVNGVGKFAPSENFQLERDAYTVPLGTSTTSVELKAK